MDRWGRTDVGERRLSSRRQRRRAAHGCDDRRPAKRLFTPEIKRFLKEWLVRRRDNPYPNRDEKRSLAVQTGLTYVQVCNWFANWRRKLKNAAGEPRRATWSHLIKAYNDQAHGNIEHFSICSDDSIWQEPCASLEPPPPPPPSQPSDQVQEPAVDVDHCYTAPATSATKYKSHMMEKYLKDIDGTCRRQAALPADVQSSSGKTGVLSKWLQSAVNFRPRRENYVGWQRKRSLRTGKGDPVRGGGSGRSAAKHARDELDAAEALTRLACTSASAS